MVVKFVAIVAVLTLCACGGGDDGASTDGSVIDARLTDARVVDAAWSRATPASPPAPSRSRCRRPRPGR